MESNDQTPPVKDNRTLQQKHFDKLYDAFYAYYKTAIVTADAPHEKVRLQLTTVFFDDLALQKAVQPIFAEYSTNVDEKRAVARAAYWDAVMLHNRTAGLKFETVKSKDAVKFLQESK